MRDRKLSSTISCRCADCGVSFFIKGDEVDVLPTMKPTKGRRKGDPLLNWADWVMHVQTHCVECRIPVPPPDCVNDLNMHVAAYGFSNSDMSEEDELTQKFNDDD
jgi:hypothetical protein